MSNETASGLVRLAYSVGEVAEMLGISQKSIYRLLDRGLLKALPDLRHKMITRKSLEAFMATAL